MTIDLNDAPRQQELPEDRIERIRRGLENCAPAFVQMLFPAAIITKHEARVGNVDGERGKSLWIGLDGNNLGRWMDHSTGEKGHDLISLYAATERLDARRDFSKIMDDLEGFLGGHQGHRSDRQKQREAEAEKPKPPGDDEELGAPVGTWHYRDENGIIIASVYRYRLESGKKTYRPRDVKNAKWGMPEVRPLYNYQGVMAADPVILVEGEKSADALNNLGFTATTAMGGSSAPIDKTDWTPIKGKHVIIWPDADKVGAKYGREAKRYLESLDCTVNVVTSPLGVKDGWDAADAVAEKRDINEILTSKRNRARLYSISDLLDLPTPDWLISNVLPETGLALLYGPSGAGKSFAAIDLALHIAHGRPWLGRATKKRAIVYIAGEGRFGIAKRAVAWHHYHGVGCAGVPFYVIPTALDLLNPKVDLEQLVDSLTRLNAPIGGVVVDTLARAFHGGDENDAKDMGAFITNCDHIRDVTGGLIMPVHHTGKDKDRGARGSSALRAAVDTEISVDRIEDTDLLTMRITKQKEAEEDGPFSFRLMGLEDPIANPETGEVLGKSAVLVANQAPNWVQQGQSHMAVWTALVNNSEGLSAQEIINQTGCSKTTIYRILREGEKERIFEQEMSIPNDVGIWSIAKTMT